MRFRTLLFTVAVLGLRGSAQAQTTTELFDDSVVHEVRITMPADRWQALKDHYLENTYYTADKLVWKGKGSNTVTINNIAIRSRGHGSRTPRKPGIHVDFNRNLTTQTFLGLTELDIKNNSQDPSLLHERLSMELFIRMGVPASREVYSRFYVNDEYIGLYTLCETINSQFLKRVFDENNGFNYEYKPGDWLTPNVVGSGYHFEFLGDDFDKYSSGTAATPFDPQTPHQNSPDTVTLHDFIQTANQAPDSTFLSDISKYMDPKAFLMHIAVETYLADFDCFLGDIFGMNNFFLYRSQKGTMNYFIAWDKDNAFDWTQRPILQNADKNVLMRRLVAIPELKQHYFDQMARVSMLAGGTGGWLQQESFRMYDQIHQAALDDQNKTYLESGLILPSSNERFEDAVVKTKAFPGDRTSFVSLDLARNGYQVRSSAPQIQDGSLINAGALSATAAGGLGALYGANFGDAGNTLVYVNGFTAPIVFASPGQLNLQAPWEATGFAVPYGVTMNGVPSTVQFTNIQTYSPGIFVVVHADSQLITDANPAKVGETLVVYCTGLGPVNGEMVTGKPAAAASTTVQATTVKMNSITSPVLYSGFTPGFLGLYQVNVTVPAGVAGTAFMDVSVNGVTAPSVNFPVR